MKCDKGTIKNSGYTLYPESGITEKEVEELLVKGKKNWSKEDKKKFKKATFGSNKFSVGGFILFAISAFIFGQIAGYIVWGILASTVPLFMLGENEISASADPLIPTNQLGASVSVLVNFAFLFLGIAIFSKVFLNTNLKHLIAGRKKFDWKLFFLIFVAYTVLLAIGTWICGIGNIELNNINWTIFAPMFIVTLILIPAQTTTEELVFRCLLSRIFYKNNLPKWPKSLILIIVSGLIFTIPHLSNPEVTSTTNIAATIFACLMYFTSGAGLMAVGLLCGSFVPSVAMHFANNFFISTVITPNISALNMVSLFTDYTSQNVELINFLQTLIINVITIFIAWLYMKRKSKNEIHN